MSESDAQQATSAGALLRAARQAQGLALEQVAAMLKVPPAKLDALESDQPELLSDAVFARGLAASACRALKIDANAVLAALPRATPTPIRTDDAGINAVFHDRDQGFGRGLMLKERRPLVLAVLVVLLVTLGILLWPRAASMPSGTTTSPVSSGTVVTPAPAVEAAPVPDAASSAAAAQSTLPADIQAASALPDVAAQPVAADTVAPLVLKVNGTSWLQVIDATGTVQLRKTALAGEQLSVSGTLPLSVIIGRADLVSAQVRGRALDLAPLTKNNVARFEVK